MTLSLCMKGTQQHNLHVKRTICSINTGGSVSLFWQRLVLDSLWLCNILTTTTYYIMKVCLPIYIHVQLDRNQLWKVIPVKIYILSEWQRNKKEKTKVRKYILLYVNILVFMKDLTPKMKLCMTLPLKASYIKRAFYDYQKINSGKGNDNRV